jgi:hypothetical protein
MVITFLQPIITAFAFVYATLLPYLQFFHVLHRLQKKLGTDAEIGKKLGVTRQKVHYIRNYDRYRMISRK